MKTYATLVRHPGNQSLFHAIEMSVVAALSGRPLHLHAEGLRGTGKTTILRAARDTLPQIRRIKGCVYNCRPDAPHCPQHRNLAQSEIAALGAELVPMPFLEISHSAKVGTVVGSIDLAALTDRDRPVAALLPGTLPRANRGIILVDEINRLADTSPDLADVLLDAMGTKPGRVQIEETGLPLTELPVEVTVWAASNPDEDPGPLADIRRQLADRFDLTVNMARPTRADVVTRILADSRPGGASPAAPTAEPVADHAAGPLAEAALRLEAISWPTALLDTVADVYVDFGLESLRAVEAMQQAASLRCALAGRDEVALDDLIGVAPLVLRHRVDLGLLARITAYLQGLNGRAKSPTGSATATPSGHEQPDLTPSDRALRPGGQSAVSRPDPAPLPLAHDAYRNAARSQQSTGQPFGQPSGASSATAGSAAAQGAGAPAATPAERGGFGRLLARFLTGAPTAEPVPARPAHNVTGQNGVASTPATNGASSTGPRAAAPQPHVAAPPNRARSLFEISADHVVNLPEDAPRS